MAGLRWNRWELLAVLALTVAAIGLRCRELDDRLWLDELHTGWCVADGWSQVAGRAAEGNHAPVFFFSAWLSTTVFGHNELALRLPSLLAGVILVPLVYVGLRRLTGLRLAAALAAAFVATDRYAILFSQEARPYAAIQLLAAVNAFAFARLLLLDKKQEASWPSRVAYVVSWILLFYTHYTTLLVMVAQGVVFVWRGGFRHRKFLLVDVAVVICCCLPAIPHLTFISGRRANWTFVEPQSIQWIVQIFRFDLYIGIPWLTAIIVGIASRWASARKETSNHRHDKRAGSMAVLQLTLAWALLPLVIAWCLTATDVLRLMFHRYVISSLVGGMCLGGMACWLLPRRRLSAIAAALALLAVIVVSGTPGEWYRGEMLGREEDWAGAADEIRQADPEGRWPLILCAGVIEDYELEYSTNDRLRAYCLFPVSSFYEFPQPAERRIPRPTSAAAIDAQLVATIRRSGRAWMLIRGRAEPEIRQATRAALSSEFKIERKSFGGVTLLHIY